MRPPSCFQIRRPAPCRADAGPNGCSWSRAANEVAAWCSRVGARWRGATRCRYSTRGGGWGCGDACAGRARSLAVTPRGRRVLSWSFCAFPQTHQGRFCFPVDPIDQRIGTEETRSPAPSHRGFSSSVGSPAFDGRTFLMLGILIQRVRPALNDVVRHSTSRGPEWAVDSIQTSVIRGQGTESGLLPHLRRSFCWWCKRPDQLPLAMRAALNSESPAFLNQACAFLMS